MTRCGREPWLCDYQVPVDIGGSRWGKSTARLGREIGVSPLLARAMVNRDFDDVAAARSFLGAPAEGIGDLFALPNMGAAVDRLLAARAAGELLVIYGDYDVDGVTSTALGGGLQQARLEGPPFPAQPSG